MVLSKVRGDGQVRLVRQAGYVGNIANNYMVKKVDVRYDANNCAKNPETHKPEDEVSDDLMDQRYCEVGQLKRITIVNHKDSCNNTKSQVRIGWDANL